MWHYFLLKKFTFSKIVFTLLHFNSGKKYSASNQKSPVSKTLQK